MDTPLHAVVIVLNDAASQELTVIVGTERQSNTKRGLE